MNVQDTPSYDDSQSPVREPNDFPAEELTPNTADDAEAGDEVEEAFDASGGCDVRWRVASGLLKLREQVNQAAPQRRKGSDGTIGDAAHCSRKSDHNPWVRDGNIGVVTAMDITHDPTRGCDADAIAEAIRAARDPRVKYIIWNKRIANSSPIGASAAWAWRPYSGANDHTKHVHVSVKPEKANYDSTAAWPV